MRDPVSGIANLEMWISLPVEASKKSEAKDLAAYKLNVRNIQLAQLSLVDQVGVKRIFQVCEVKYVEWLQVEDAEYSHHYRVNGRMEVTLAECPDTLEGSYEIGELKLPQSAIQPKPILIIPTTKEPLVLQVRRQLLKWVPVRNHEIVYIIG